MVSSPSWWLEPFQMIVSGAQHQSEMHGRFQPKNVDGEDTADIIK